MKGKLNKKEVDKVLDILEELYPDAEVELNHSNTFELLIATILSAQCTDKRVNKITKELFKEYNTPKAFLTLTQEELGEKIRTCGFYRNKSKNILGACQMIIEEFDGKVPDTREELMKLPGVGRKTANVVLSNAFSVDAIAVDTHVFRVSNRIGLANSKDVLDTEKDLMENIKKERWSKAHHLLIFHGRRICKARKPMCEKCPLKKYCNYYKENFN
ncbi:endonuclease III [Anaerosalibacter massiliensis]|uniref:endonuclease III n=1 Tax=Anaerosalibacter massiliensis TaxID=1347392 RepID=UPI000AA28617|nr:endonuclease III [Anaerosalibacter massiliensis]